MCYTSSMNRLQIYPTSRAIRRVAESLRNEEGFAPSLMRMDEFEKRAILVKERRLVDPLERILLLKEAAAFKAFETIKIDRDLVRFFTKSDAIFKFFEELSAEEVSIEALAQADAYAEFDVHLLVLEELRERYRALLEAKGLSDRMFIPESYELNVGFLKSYSHIEIYLEGYLSRFELALLRKVATHTPVSLHYTTSRFTQKMIERFETFGIALKSNQQVHFDLGSGTMIEAIPYNKPINATVLSVEQRNEQVALALLEIEKMVQRGILPEEIVLILPDESFKSHFMLFDHLNNLNFAMGYDYANSRVVHLLEALYGYWQQYDKRSYELLARYGVDDAHIAAVRADDETTAEGFFAFLEALGLLDVKAQEQVRERYSYFCTLFKEAHFSYKTWLFLWLKSMRDITLDDVRGGKVTVMGVLETRGVSFKGVVIVDFNEGVVPASSSKDMFLNSTVRAFAKLPTRHDREALQKQYYHRLLQEAQEAVIIYSTSDEKLPSKFLYELGLPEATTAKAPLQLLYPQPSQIKPPKDPEVDTFDASAQTWSASRLKTFLECKRKYYYRYIQKIAPREDERFNEGAFLHTLLEHLYKDQDHFNDEVALQERLYRLMDELLPQEDALIRYRKLFWKQKLQGFVKEEIAHFKQGWRVVAREKEVVGTIGGLKFKGRIDRIDQNETATMVLDYKSGNLPKEPKRGLNPDTVTDFQMSIYHQLLQKHYQHIDLAYLKILEGGQKQQVTLLEEREALLGEHIVTLKQTKGFVAQKCESLEKCRYCEFALMCERGAYL